MKITTQRSIVILAVFVGFAIAASALPAHAQTTTPTLRWSADSVVPVGYHGRVLPSPRNTLTVVAEGAPTTLYYQWSVNGVVQDRASGVGETILSTTLSEMQQNPPVVSVTLLNQGSQEVGFARITTPVMQPRLVMTGHNASGRQHLLSTNDPFPVPVGSAQFSLHTLFAPRSWINTQIITWEILNEQSQEPWHPTATTTLDIENRGSNDIDATIRATIERATTMAPLRINGIPPGSGL